MTTSPWTASLGSAAHLGGPLDLACVAGLTGLLLWAAAADLRHRRIPNAASAGVAALWPAYALLAAGAPVAVSAGIAGGAAVFVAGFLLWRCGLLGGGDVKLLAALSLWAAGGGLLLPFLLATGLLGGSLAAVWIMSRRGGLVLPARVAVGLSRAGLPVLPGDARGLPYGVAIGLAGAWLAGRLLWR